MAIYGLQIDCMNKILSEYFGLANPTINENEFYLGLGLTQFGAQVNTDDFTEVFGGRPLGNYKRARIIFGKANEGSIYNENEVLFNTPSEDWTDSTKLIEMVGIFNTLDYEDNDKNLIKPMVVLRLPNSETALRGETLTLAPQAIRLSLTDF